MDTASLTPRDIHQIVSSALGSLNNAVISHGAVSTSVLVGGKFVLAITPYPKHVQIQCVKGLDVHPRGRHLKRQRSSDNRWETWITSTGTGLASFVHQAAPSLGRMAEEAKPAARIARNDAAPPEAEVPSVPADFGEGPITQGAYSVSPGDVEEIAIRWHKVGDSPSVKSARAVAIRALTPAWAPAKARILNAIDVRRQELGDDLPWESARAAALDALRAVLARDKLSTDAYTALTEAWSGVPDS